MTLAAMYCFELYSLKTKNINIIVPNNIVNKTKKNT